VDFYQLLLHLNNRLRLNLSNLYFSFNISSLIKKIYSIFKRRLEFRGSQIIILFIVFSFTTVNLKAAYNGTKELTDKQVKATIWKMVFHDRKILHEQIQQTLQGYLDNPQSVDIKLVPEESSKLLGGAFKEIVIEMHGSEVDELKVSYAYLHLKNCVLDLYQLVKHNKFRLKSEGQNNFVIQVTEEDLNAVFKAKSDKLKLSRPKLDFREGHVRFSGGIHILFFKDRVKVDGVFAVRNGDELHFNPKWMNVGILPIPGFVLSKIRKKINPITTLRDFKFKLNMELVKVTNHSFVIASKGMDGIVNKIVENDNKKDIGKEEI